MKILQIISFVFLVSGCVGQQSQHGDLGVFLIQKLKTHNAILSAESSYSEIDAIWNYSYDENGFVINVQDNCFSEVDQLFRELFGEPMIWEDENIEGYPQGVFSYQQAGVVLQYLQTKEGLEIICIKSPKKAEPVIAH